MMTEAGLVVDQMRRSGLMSTGFKKFKKKTQVGDNLRISWNEDALKASKPRRWLVASTLDEFEWFAQTFNTAASQKSLKASLEACSEAYQEMPSLCMHCSSSKVAIRDITVLGSQLECQLDYDRQKKTLTLRRTVSTKLDITAMLPLLHLVLGKEPVFSWKPPQGAATAKHVVGKHGRFIRMLESAHRVRLSFNEDYSLLQGWITADGDLSWKQPGQGRNTSLRERFRDYVAKLKADARERGLKVEKDINAHLDDIREKKACSLPEDAHHAKNRTKCELQRTFSTEFKNLKAGRAEQRDKAREKADLRKEHLQDKSDRLQTRRGRRKEKDKGEAMHGGRHKGKDDFVPEDMMPPVTMDPFLPQ